MNAERNCRHCADTGMATLGSTNSLFCSWCNNDGTRINIAGPPHPDTARADAAEKRLAELEAWAAGVDAVLGNLCWGRHDAQRVRKPLSAFPLAAERAALAATERELEGLTR